jgi:hypothetical protein
MIKRFVITAAACLEIVVGATFLAVPDLLCRLLFAAAPEGVAIPHQHVPRSALFLVPSGFHVCTKASSFRFRLAGKSRTRLGSRHHSAARAGTKGNGLTSHRAFDLQQRYRLRSVV